VDHRQFLPAYQPVTLASVLDRSVMQYGITHSFSSRIREQVIAIVAFL
jgi:hypothetical protein